MNNNIVKTAGFLDQYKMVGCNKSPVPISDNTENGLLFTIVYIQSLIDNPHITGSSFDFPTLFNKCFIDGILYRSPEPHPKPESHDNYTACALGALISGRSDIAATLLWSLIKHLGVIRGEWLIRFVQLPLFFIPIVLPILKPFLFPLYKLYVGMQNPDIKDASGIQLQYVIVSIADRLYPNAAFKEKWFNKLKDKNINMYDVFKTYYSRLHPITRVWET